MRPEDLAAATPEKPVRVGRYDVVGVLGAGGMGIVFDAVDRDHGTRVALKTLSHLAPERLLRFKAEFRRVAHLSHENLVALHELSCDDDLWYFTMERVVGTDFVSFVRGSGAVPASSSSHEAPTVLEGVVRSRDARSEEPTPSPPLSFERVRDALAQLVRGVRALHAAGLLHLDLKPSNVMVETGQRAGRVVVLDFGLVRAARAEAAPPSSSSPPTVAGTPPWMAPEQHAGEGIGEASDWYAVGLMLYVALTGVPAFSPASPPLTWYSKRHLRPTAPDRLVEGVPADLAALAMELLDPDPEKRPRGEELVRLTARGPLAPEARGDVRLVGRAAERARLAEACRLAADGESAVVHLVGPSGVGKTALLASLAEIAAREHGALVLRGRCYQQESAPHKAFDGLLDELVLHLLEHAEEEPMPPLPAWIDELARVFPVLGALPNVAAPPGEDVTVASALESRRRAAEALRELFARLAERRPLVLLIDDLQWADADSAALLARIVEPPLANGLVLAATFRAREVRANAALAAYFERVAAHARSVTVDVGALPPPDAERLAKETLAAHGTNDDALAAAVAREAQGVPFFVQELAREAAARPPAERAVTLEEVLARRLAALGRAERSLVEVLAVADNPISLAAAIAVAEVAPDDVLSTLASLRGASFVRGTGPGAADRVELHHDRLRVAALAAMTAARHDDLHLGLGRALAKDALFDAVRHLDAVAHRLDARERLEVAKMNLEAARRARRGAAFALAFERFRAGAGLLDERAWVDEYDLALALHAGAAETAYLSGAWGELDGWVAKVKAHAKTPIEQLSAWEVEIDACIARTEYDRAVASALEALRLLAVELPAHPGEAEVGAELQRAMAALATVGADGMAKLPDARDPAVLAAMRIEGRISSAAYFARPMLLPVIACRLVVASVEHGLSPATPYALAVYGIVLNTIGMHREAHAWGTAALDLLGRWDDDSLEARTRHVVHDLVCTWTVPLAGTLESLHQVVEIGQRTGDLEYAGYAAHAWVHNAFYAGLPLAELLEEAIRLGGFLRAQGQVNALHVHVPFEQALRCFTGQAADPASLDGGGFSEEEALAAARASGSRSAQCIVRLLMGMVRFHFGGVAEASACLEAAREFVDGVASTWHVPMLHLYAALAIHALPAAERASRMDRAEASLAALRRFAEQGPDNFGHQVELVLAARARADGDRAAAREHALRAVVSADRGGWLRELALAHAIAAWSDPTSADAHLSAAREAYARWGVPPALAARALSPSRTSS